MPELAEPEITDGARYLWLLFVQVHNATDGQISPTAIKDHFALCGVKLNRLEYRALLAVNNARAGHG